MNGKSKGFTLVEIMVVVVILGLLMSTAIQSFQSIRANAQASSFANDLRVLRDAVELYNSEYGGYPPDGGPGEAPDELKHFLPHGFFDRDTPIGGTWDLDMDAAAGVEAAVGVADASVGDDLISLIDGRIDDGVSDTGSFQILNSRPYWILKE